MPSNMSNKPLFPPFLLDAPCCMVEKAQSNTSYSVQQNNPFVVYIYDLKENIYYYTTGSYISKCFSLLDCWTVGYLF